MTYSKDGSPKIGSDITSSTMINGLRFPAQLDYEAYFLRKGVICYPHELWENDELVKGVQRHWHTKGQSGCVFAQIVATRADELGWDSYVARNTRAETILPVINEAIANPGCQNLSLLFPDITTGNMLRDLILELARQDIVRINATREFQDLVIIELRTPISDSAEAWLVGFGPFDFFPKTRQAPIVEIAIRTKLKPVDLNSQLNQDARAAHLADIPIDLDDDRFSSVLVATKERIKQIIGDESRETSKAKVTFTFPKEIWYSNQ